MAMTRRETLKMSGGLGAFAAMAACSKSPDPAETDINRMDAVETAARIKAGDITAAEAINAAIDRAEAVNPAINAIVSQNYDKAREAAAAPASGPLSGVPTFVKDLNDVIGLPTGNGSRAYDGYMATAQFPFIDDLEATGAISLGKSSTPEFGLTATTEPLSSGVTRNPWNTDHSTGGSSGGAAALVAAGVAPIAHASDGGGSIRIPASCCGTVGLKVSNDRYRPARDESRIPVRISVQGCESRTVRDTAAFLAALEDANGPLAPVGLVAGPSKEQLKIAYFIDAPSGVPVDAEVRARTEEAVELCRSLGHEMREMAPPADNGLGDSFLLYWASIANFVVTSWEQATGRTADDTVFEPLTLGLQEHFRANEKDIGAAILALIGFATTYREMFAETDVLLSPALTAPPPKIGYLDTTLDYDTAIERLLAYAQYTSIANIAGAPSLCLPLGQSADGLPIGTLFNAPVGAEGRLLALGYELEEAAPWRGRTPPVFAAT